MINKIKKRINKDTKAKNITNPFTAFRNMDYKASLSQIERARGPVAPGLVGSNSIKEEDMKYLKSLGRTWA